VNTLFQSHETTITAEFAEKMLVKVLCALCVLCGYVVTSSGDDRKVQ
jgi:hypothetical protein